MRKKLIGLLAMLFFSLLAFGQTKEVTGKVTDSSGGALPNASITEKGTRNGVRSGADGTFKITVKPGARLVISEVGYEPQEVAAGGNLNISLLGETRTLSEVVVTALGVKRDNKALGYANQQLASAELNQTNPTSALSAMSGKIAGADVTNTSGTPGAATFIRIRGITSIGGDGQPLLVVDGMPIDNSTSQAQGGQLYNNVAESNRGVDINPQDIESISVIKGAAGTALYGTQGSNGVILITTKKGKKNSKSNLSYSYGVTTDKVTQLPGLQQQFTQGSGGRYSGPGSYTQAGNGYTAVSWGANIDTLYRTGVATVWDPKGDIVGKSTGLGKVALTPYNRYAFFQTGVSQTHNVSISGGGESFTYRMSYSNLNQTGIIPNSSFQRNSLSLSVDGKLNSQLTAGANVIYTYDGGQRVQQGSNLNGVMLGLLRTPLNFDDGYVPAKSTNSYEFPDGTQRTYRGIGDGSIAYYDNPYFTVNKNLYNDLTGRLVASTFLTYTPTDWITITDRIGVDAYTTNVKQDYAVNSSSYNVPTGRVIISANTNKIVNNDFLATLSHKFGPKINGSLLLGANLYSLNNTFLSSNGTGLAVPNFYDLSNAASILANDFYETIRKKAGFAQARVSYDNYLFLDATVRTENSSAFISSNNPKGQWFTFPGVEGSFVFTDALKMNNSVLSYGKLRASWGKAGLLPAPYNTSVTYGTALVTDGWVNNGLTYPSPGGQVGYFQGSLVSNNIKPEITTSYEFGTDLRFINNRIGLGFTYYHSLSDGLLVFQPVSYTTGSAQIYANAASIRNQGVEVTLNAKAIKTRDFSWDVTVNFSANRSKVLSLGNGVSSYFLAGFGSGEGSAYDIPGQPAGVIYGTAYIKDSHGNLVINDDPTASTPVGQPIEAASDTVLGNPNPKWIAGLLNKFTYKGFSLSVLFDTKQKFDIWNGTRGALDSRGLSAGTANRGQTYTFAGVAGHLDANGNTVLSGKQNATPTVLDQTFYSNQGAGITGPYVEDGTFVKLREVALSYYLDFSKTGKAKFVKGINLSIVGRNLWIHTKYSGVDPETSLGTANALGLDYFNNPGTKSIGANATINF